MSGGVYFKAAGVEGVRGVREEGERMGRGERALQEVSACGGWAEEKDGGGRGRAGGGRSGEEDRRAGAREWKAQ